MFFDPPEGVSAEDAAVLRHVFYQRWPAERVVSLLFSPPLRRRCSQDELFKIKREIEAVIYLPDHKAHCQSDYDWKAARRRVEAVLEQHDASLPTPKDLTWYEEEEKQHTDA